MDKGSASSLESSLNTLGHPPSGPGDLNPAGAASEKWHKAGEKTLKHQQGEGTEDVKMHWGVTFSTFGLLLGVNGPALAQDTDKITVDIIGSDVTLSCHIQDPNARWWKKKGGELKDLGSGSSALVAQDNGMYSCGPETGKKKSIFLQVKECPGCMEMDIWVVLGIVLADLLVTSVVLILTYFWSQKRAARFSSSPTAGGPRRRPRGQKEDRPPPVPNPDYEPIRKGQREVYAGLEPRAF